VFKLDTRILILRQQLKEKCWSKDTSFSKMEGSRGQCYVTALLVNELFGGFVMHGYITFNGKREHHFWNMVSGREIDLTSDQYDGDGFNPVIHGETYDKPNFKNRCYLKLKAKYNALNQ
jgi:hypothetical protein